MISAGAERALQPLDNLRRHALRAAVRVPPLRRAMLRRETRVPLLMSAHALVAFLLAVFIPSLSLVLAPLALGVPHVASDVRHLVVRRAVPRWWMRAVWAFAVALVGARLMEEIHAWPALSTLSMMRAEHALASAWLLVGAIGGAHLGARNTRLPTRAGIIAVALAISAAAWFAPIVFRLVFVQAHNLIAIAIWLAVFRRRLRGAWIPLTFIVVGAGALASGALLRTTVEHGVLSFAGLHLFVAADWLAPGLGDANGIAFTVTFAFLQSVHYAIWLIAIPQEDARAGATTTFRTTWRDLIADFTPLGVGLVIAIGAIVLLAGIQHPLVTRNLVLSLATFHSWMELAALAFLLASGRLATNRDATSART